MTDSLPDTAATDECVPPCPVADGAMGLLCTCGNVSKRWAVTRGRLIADQEATLDFYRRGLDIDPSTDGACRD